MGCVPSDTECSDDERPRHQVTLPAAFDLMATEATVGMVRSFASATRAAGTASLEWR